MTDKNIEYYDKNADAFFAGSINADMSEVRAKFSNYIPYKGRILDAGCGSGRDSKAFLDMGYEVVSFDASAEMCKRATDYIGRSVLQMRFEDVAYVEKFDGVWACASLLHVRHADLPDVMERMRKALKPSGVLYASFKYGNGSCLRGDRSFIDFTDQSIASVFEQAGFSILSNNVGNDSRPGREEEKWVNIIGRRP